MAASEVFTKDDITNTLRSVLLMAQAQPVADTPHNAAYRKGIVTGIAAVAVALGIPAEAVTSALRGNR